ncbi:MAG: alkaline phosphatase family protein [Pirellulales bacterium]|nr:alkaline phosphatase family protein [Pirellulales bacterium]
MHDRRLNQSRPGSCSGSESSRRDFLKAAGAAALAAGCGRSGPPHRDSRSVSNMIILGVDGMDPVLLERLVREGRMPNCRRLMENGSFHRLRTTDPPQSPVAWSTFISGTNPGGHGIFDFVARDPRTMLPFHSAACSDEPSNSLRIGRWKLPLSAGHIHNRRRGPTFWNELERHGIDCTIFRIPGNFPPTQTEAVTLSGMGTPDLLGTYGDFTFFTDDPSQSSRDVPGGRIRRVAVERNVVECDLFGPANPYTDPKENTRVPLRVYLDPEAKLAKIVIQQTSILLAEGQWSDWVVVKFTLLPLAVEASGICRFLLKQVRGGFRLYASPVNINPADPSLPISTPPDYAHQLVRELGFFYTQGMIEDTHALSSGVLSPGEYRQQATFVLNERMRFFEHELGRFHGGLLFFYISSLDPNCHMFWRTLDRDHPSWSDALAREHGDFIPELYGRVDRAIGQVLARAGRETLVWVMSDHGFTSFRRQFNLNSWLMDHGYVGAKDPAARGTASYLLDVDWDRTLAYGLGINGLYLNLKGREAHGTVAPGEQSEALTDELIAALKTVRDPGTGGPVISNVFRAGDLYSGPYVSESPDLIVAYHNYYRASWDTVLGGFPEQHILDNTDAWSGDHCVDSRFVPGVLLSNRPMPFQDPSLEDLAPTILTAMGVTVPAGMTGRVLWKS